MPYTASSSVKASAPVGTGDYVVKQGECVASIAVGTGHFWKTIWNLAENAELKKARGNPNILLPGDRLSIPPIEPRTDACDSEKRHTFVRRGATAKLQLRVLEESRPRANEAFTVHIGNQAVSGTTDAEGRLEVAIPAWAKLVVLQIGADVMHVAMGGIDPLETITGIQTRLCNLGFSCNYTGVLDAQTLSALNAFRAIAGLPMSDTLDSDTNVALATWHDQRSGTPVASTSADDIPDGPAEAYTPDSCPNAATVGSPLLKSAA